MRRELICLEPSSPPRLQVRESAMPEPRRGQVLVRVEATSVNPIDAKRAGGYGQRLLGLKGAGRFPLVLGNDLAGRVEAVGPGVAKLARGQRVFGLVATGKGGGAHASHVVVPESLLAAAPKDVDAAGPRRAALLVHDDVAGGALDAAHPRQRAPASASSSTAPPVRWGGWPCSCCRGGAAHITAICEQARATSAARSVRMSRSSAGHRPSRSLPTDFDVVLNFASWDDELALASRLGANALGHATTVHPLLGNFDRLGWLRGALASRRDAQAVRSAVRRRSAGAHYAWTTFKPDPRSARRAGRRGARAAASRCRWACAPASTRRTSRSPMSRRESPAVPCCNPDPHRPTRTRMTP